MSIARTYAFVLLVVLGTGCEDSLDDAFTRRCHPAASPTLFASKLDDDDGDGNPLDENFPDVNDEDDDIADHSWVRDQFGIYHLFFHSESLYYPNQIEHYTTRDFVTLEYVGVALTVNAGAWDGDALWAPHVIEFDETYYMFYTGVAGSGPSAIQRIGLAISDDLTTWTRVPVNRCAGTTGDGCIYDCDEPWTMAGGPNDSYNQQCRDPFVMWDEGNRRWLLFATAKSTNHAGVVTVASASELSTWAGEGYLDATRRLATGSGAQTTGGQCENAFLVTDEGTHYLLFTDWQDAEDSLTVANPRTIAQYATATTLAFDSLGSADWVYRGYTPDPGVNALEVIPLRRGGVEWVMSQSVSGPRSGLPKKSRRQLRMMCVSFDRATMETSNWGLLPDATGLIVDPRE
jgi:sucrose-6-phosphate hydrolase SacC (GH32 family)